MKYIILIITLIIVNITYAQVAIGESTQASATERNNARLIVEDTNGNLHIVYYDNGVFYSFSDDSGSNWTEPTLVDGTGRNPSLAIDTDNILHLVYKLGGINAYDIVHRTYSNTTWSEIDYVYHDTNYIAAVSRPVLAIDSENNLHCVWQKAGYMSTPNSEIWYNKYISGSDWETPVNISNSFGASEYPTLTIDNDNNVFAFWKDSGEDINNDKMVLYRKFTIGTGWDVDYTNISNTTGNGSYATMDPCAVTDSNGDIHLVWKDSESGNREILYKKCTAGIWDINHTNISNTAEASAHPSISTDSQGNLYVFWAEKIGGVYYEIAYKKYDIALNTWSNFINISNSTSVESEYPNTPTHINNTISVVWTEGDISPFLVIYWGEGLLLNIEEFNDNLFISLFPNPSTGIFTINNENIQSITVTNSNYQIVYASNKLTHSNKLQVNLTEYVKGIYFVKIQTDALVVVKKIILE